MCKIKYGFRFCHCRLSRQKKTLVLSFLFWAWIKDKAFCLMQIKPFFFLPNKRCFFRFLFSLRWEKKFDTTCPLFDQPFFFSGWWQTLKIGLIVDVQEERKLADKHVKEESAHTVVLLNKPILLNKSRAENVTISIGFWGSISGLPPKQKFVQEIR